MSEILYLDLYKHAVPFQNWQTSLILNILIFWHFSHQLMAHIRCSQTSFTYNSLGHWFSKGTLISVSAKPYWFWAEPLCWSLRILWTWVLLAHSWRFKLFQVCLPLLSCLGIVLWVASTLCVTRVFAILVSELKTQDSFLHGLGSVTSLLSPSTLF